MSDSYLNNVELGKEHPDWDTELGLISWAYGKAYIPGQKEYKYDTLLGKCQVGTSAAPLDNIFCSSSYYDLWSTETVGSVVGNFHPRNRGWKLTSNVDRMQLQFDKLDQGYVKELSSDEMGKRLKLLIARSYGIALKDVKSSIIENITHTRRSFKKINMFGFKKNNAEIVDLSKDESIRDFARKEGYEVFPGENYFKYERGGRWWYRLMDSHDKNFHPMVNQECPDGVSRSELLEITIPKDETPTSSNVGVIGATEEYVLKRMRQYLKVESIQNRYLHKISWMIWYMGYANMEAGDVPELAEVMSEYDSATSAVAVPRYYSDRGVEDDPGAWSFWKAQYIRLAKSRAYRTNAGSWVDGMKGAPYYAKLVDSVNLNSKSMGPIEPRYQGTFEASLVPKDDDALDEVWSSRSKDGTDFDSQHFFEIQQVITNILCDETVTFAHFLENPIHIQKINNLDAAGLKYDVNRHFAGPANYLPFSGPTQLTFRRFKDDGSSNRGYSYGSLKVVDDLSEFFTGGVYPYKYNSKTDDSPYSVRNLNSTALVNKFDFPVAHNGDISNASALYNQVREHVISNNLELGGVIDDFKVMFNPEVQTNVYLITARYANFLSGKGESADVNMGRLEKLTLGIGDQVADIPGDLWDSMKSFWNNQTNTEKKKGKIHMETRFWKQLSEGATRRY